MKRSEFLKSLAVAPAALAVPAISFARGARMVLTDGRSVPWTEGEIFATSETAYGVTEVRVNGHRVDAVVWMDPTTNEVRLLSIPGHDVPPGVELIKVEAAEHGWPEIHCRAPFEVHYSDGRAIYSAEAA